MQTRKPVLALTVALLVAAGGVGSAYANQTAPDVRGGTQSHAPSRIDDTSGDPLIAAAGDIACRPGVSRTSSACHYSETAKMLASADQVLTLGDNQYESGTSTEYAGAFAKTWGLYKAKIQPAPGNHEYKTSGASGYFKYFAVPSYYSYNLGAWHLVSLNSNVSMAEGSAQNNWLEKDLAANTAKCTLTYFHHPRYTAGNYSPGVSSVKPLWTDMLADRVDVTLAGHDHQYQRFASMNGSGGISSTGVRQFVVGTGGKSHYPIQNAYMTGLQKYNTTSFGVLRMVLHAGSYDWEFAADDGTVKDAGTAACV